MSVQVFLFQVQYFKRHMQFKPWKTNVHVSCGWWEFLYLWLMWGYMCFMMLLWLQHVFKCALENIHLNIFGMFHIPDTLIPSFSKQTWNERHIALLLLQFIVALGNYIWSVLFGHCSQWGSIQKRGAHANALQYLCGILHILYFCHWMVFVVFILCPPSNRIYTLKLWQMIW